MAENSLTAELLEFIITMGSGTSNQVIASAVVYQFDRVVSVYDSRGDDVVVVAAAADDDDDDDEDDGDDDNDNDGGDDDVDDDDDDDDDEEGEIQNYAKNAYHQQTWTTTAAGKSTLNIKAIIVCFFCQTIPNFWLQDDYCLEDLGTLSDDLALAYIPTGGKYTLIPQWDLLKLPFRCPGMQWSHWHVLRVRTLVDEIYGCSISKRVAVTYMNVGHQDISDINGHHHSTAYYRSLSSISWSAFFHNCPFINGDIQLSIMAIFFNSQAQIPLAGRLQKKLLWNLHFNPIM